VPYDPKIKNRAGAIYGQGIKTAAAYEAAGIREGAAGIAKGIKLAGSEFGAGIEKAGDVWARQAAQKKADADLWSALNTKIDTYGKMGFLTGRDADALAGIKKPNDLAAALTVIEQDIGRRQQAQQQLAQQNAMFERQYAIEAMKQRQKAIEAQNAAQPGDTKVITDPVTGEKTTYIFQNSGQIIPLNEQKNKKAPATGVTKVEIGPGQYIYQDQEGKTINPKYIKDTSGLTDLQKSTLAQEAANLQSERTKKLSGLQETQARIAGEVAKGNKKPGPDWWPFGESHETKLKGITTEINTLQVGGAQAQPSAAQQPTAATAYASPEAVRAAYRNGAFGDLSDPQSKAAAQAAATKILREQFGY
jgi:hypothetical protein